MQSRSGNNIKGIDVSNWQGNIDFSQVKNDGIKIVYIKASEGTYYVDPYRISNYNNAKANGLRVGFYHFFRAKNEEEAKNEAWYFVSCISNFVDNCDCKFCLDIETNQNLGRNTLSNLAKIFLEEVKTLTGKGVVLYTYTYFAQSYLNSSLSEYPLWIAHYGVDTPGDNPIWDSWIGFQYTDSGNVAGISGNCDMNEFKSDIYIEDKSAAPSKLPEGFREDYYLYVNPDVADAVSNELYGLKSGAQHYMGQGYLENREYKPTLPSDFVESVYLDLNSDVKQAVVSGLIPSGAWHWLEQGWKENRPYK